MLLLALVLAVAGVAALMIDCPTSKWCVENEEFGVGFTRRPGGGLLDAVVDPRNLRQILYVTLSLAERFGHAAGLLLIAPAIYLFDPARRWALTRLLGVALGAGGLAAVVKLFIARTRPNSFGFQGDVLSTFGDWLPLLQYKAAYQSFPSAHTATAVGLAAVLVWLYPRGRWLFVTMVVAVAAQRIVSGYHYPSDTLWGAAIGCVLAAVAVRDTRLSRLFLRWEEALQRWRYWPFRCCG
jgi:membrane-associated phospholipid phosphatase